MRIIAGTNRGRKIKQPQLDTVRPTKDRVREAVFSMIADRIPEAEVLDIFSGSGAYGLEALSRGAKSCVFIEKDPECANILQENISILKEEEKSSNMTMDALEAVKSLGGEKAKFDLIFSDAPYTLNINKKLLIMIYQYDILKPTGMLVIEHSSQEELPAVEGDVSFYKQKTYGDTTISLFLRK
ncbi:16S rRNA (guanine(966)-N(2))-methyltransferase RsmD [Candidatus Omnitrophota bacterium]